KLEGKNAASTGSKLGIDKFSLSLSDSPREGEHYYEGAGYGYYTYAYLNGAVTVEEMTNSIEWSGEKQLLFTPSANMAGVSLDVYNDLWLDSEFDTVDGTMRINSTIVSNDYASMLKGTTWEASKVMGAETNHTETGLGGKRIAVMLYGEQMNGSPSLDHLAINGNAVRVKFAGPSDTNKLAITSAGIFNVDSGFGVPLLFAGGASVTINNGTTAWSDWVEFPLYCDRYADLEGGDHNHTTYAVWFDVAPSPPPNRDSCLAWEWYSTKTNIMTYIGGYPAGIPTNKVYVVQEVEVGYPKQAWFQSGFFDTRIPDPDYKFLNFTVTNQTVNCDVDVRLGNTDDRVTQSDLQLWPLTYFENGVNNSLAGMNQGQYVKYDALFTATAGAVPPPYDEASQLSHVMVEWEPPIGIVDLNMDLCMGPDFGIYSATVDDKALARGIEINMTIFEDSIMGKRHQTLGSMKIVPLNTGK
ncbi:MAG: hypothetical protein JXN60_07140, partial [Lentisphaerae bacterium]|nr:hypothetical protein [Lentisphaerota bacterium]